MKLAGLILAALPMMADDATLYRASLAALVAANAVYVHSSWGHVEANPILGRGRRFDGRSAAIKGGIVGGLMLTQWLIARRNPGVKRRLAVINFAVAGGVGAVAARNYEVTR
jgi:hypothetical protein